MILSAWPIIPIILSVRSCYTLYISYIGLLMDSWVNVWIGSWMDLRRKSRAETIFFCFTSHFQ